MFYNIIIGTDKENHTLTYRLENHRPARVWAELIKKLSPADLRKNLNPRRGDASNWDKKISRLNNLIDSLNLWLPKKIIGLWDDNDPCNSLNRLHVHFPEQEKNESDIKKRNQLSEYNDLIHEIEFMYHSKLDNKNRLYFLCCFENKISVPIKEEDYVHFQIQRNFGDLLLHYPHVGRHPLELAVQKDYNCPADQIICQHEISADHSLRFSDFKPSFDEFEKFYHSSGHSWPYSVEDPKLAVGFIKLGILEKINGSIFTRDGIQEILSKPNEIKSWNISP